MTQPWLEYLTSYPEQDRSRGRLLASLFIVQKGRKIQYDVVTDIQHTTLKPLFITILSNLTEIENLRLVYISSYPVQCLVLDV